MTLSEVTLSKIHPTKVRYAENHLECQVERLLQAQIIPAITGNGRWLGNLETPLVKFSEVPKKPYFLATVEYKMPLIIGGENGEYETKKMYFSYESLVRVLQDGANFPTASILKHF